MIELIILPIFAFLNRLRGGGWFDDSLPSRALYWVTLCVFCIACTVLNWIDALVFTAAYFAWAVYAWGRWFDLGNMPELERKIKPLEKIIECISFGSDYIAFGVRMAFASPFLAYFGWVYALVFPLACVAIYALSWRFFPDTDDDAENLWVGRPITKAELATGTLWGAFLLSIAGG